MRLVPRTNILSSKFCHTPQTGEDGAGGRETMEALIWLWIIGAPAVAFVVLSYAKS